FFQAEDGIRDFHVTGVQTCALPISTHTQITSHLRPGELRDGAALAARDQMLRALNDEHEGASTMSTTAASAPIQREAVRPFGWQIGRASCRERGWVSGVGVA